MIIAFELSGILGQMLETFESTVRTDALLRYMPHYEIDKRVKDYVIFVDTLNTPIIDCEAFYHLQKLNRQRYTLSPV